MNQSEALATMADARTRKWNPAEFLENPEDVVAYLQAAFEDGNADLILAVLKDVAQSEGMKKIVAKSSRPSPSAMSFAGTGRLWSRGFTRLRDSTYVISGKPDSLSVTPVS